MDNSFNITPLEMYEAVVSNDESYDTVFFYAVKSTGIYCRPSCKSKAPKVENTEFFKTAEEAKLAGYRACKRCRSDLHDYKPMKLIAEKLKLLIDDMFADVGSLNSKIDELGLSRKRIVEVFKDEYGKTPSSYAYDLRYAESLRLLEQTDTELVDISYSVGFSSLSAFYKFFKERTGISPAAYRKGKRQ